jgi:hypothetical protein
MSNDFSFRILQDIARDLSGDVVSFPTFLDITFQVRTALKKPESDDRTIGAAGQRRAIDEQQDHPSG